MGQSVMIPWGQNSYRQLSQLTTENSTTHSHHDNEQNRTKYNKAGIYFKRRMYFLGSVINGKLIYK